MKSEEQVREWLAQLWVEVKDAKLLIKDSKRLTKRLKRLDTCIEVVERVLR